MSKRVLKSVWGPAVPAEPPDQLLGTSNDILDQIDKNRKSTKGITKEVIKGDKRACRWLVSALYQGGSCFPPAPVALPRIKRSFGSTGAAAKNLPPYNSAIRAIEAAEQLGYLILEKAPFQLGVRQLSSRMYPAGDALRLIRELGPIWRRIEPIKWADQLMIGSRKAGTRRTLLEQELQTPRVRKWLDEMSLVNQLLAKTCCCLDVPDDLLAKIGEEMRSGSTDEKDFTITTLHDTDGINYSARQLIRIFIDSNMEGGGRLYCGWWQGVPDKYRRNIIIDENFEK